MGVSANRILEASLIKGLVSTKNYLKNGDAEFNTAPWATYADAAAATPVDMTGGSATVTWTRSTSSPLINTSSFLFTKDAANRQGEGVACAFTIDRAQQAKTLQISGVYEVVSGTYATGDLGIYVYDVTNSLLIQPSGYQVVSVSSTQAKISAVFQTSANSTSYRVGFHTASTSASAYVLKFDQLTVSENQSVYGAPVTDWTTYTPTISAWSTNATATGRWRRVGDSLELRVQVDLSGAPTGTLSSVSLPAGLTIDTTKVPGTQAAGVQVYGYGSIKAAGTAAYGCAVEYSTTTTVTPVVWNVSGTYLKDNAITATVPGVFASGDLVQFSAFIPIAGWGSSVAISDSADTRVVAASYATSTQTIGTTATTFAPTSKLIDTHNAYSGGVYTVQVPGTYRVAVYLAGTSVVGVAGKSAFNAILQKNNSNVIAVADYQFASTSSVFPITSGSALVSCVAGDQLKVIVSRDATTNTFDLLGTIFTAIHFDRLSGPVAIAASEQIAARYTSNVAQGLTSPFLLDFATRDYDTHGAVTTGASWKFTAPAPGRYRVTACSELNSVADTAGNLYSHRLYKNGTPTQYISSRYVESTAVTAKALQGSGTIALVAGDTIDVRLEHTLSGSHQTNTNSSSNWIAVERL
jgi:hypothetical protein